MAIFSISAAIKPSKDLSDVFAPGGSYQNDAVSSKVGTSSGNNEPLLVCVIHILLRCRCKDIHWRTAGNLFQKVSRCTEIKDAFCSIFGLIESAYFLECILQVIAADTVMFFVDSANAIDETTKQRKAVTKQSLPNFFMNIASSFLIRLYFIFQHHKIRVFTARSRRKK